MLQESEAWSAWDAERAELAARRESLAVQIAEANAADTKAREAHAAKVAHATRKGKPIPKPPTPVERGHLDHALSVQNADEQAHRARCGEVYADAADGGALDALAAREQARHARLADLAPVVAEIVAEARGDARLARDLVGAVDRRAGLTIRPPRAEGIDVGPDFGRLLAAALAGRSLLDPQSPVVAPSERRIQVDRDTDDSGAAGMARALAAGAGDQRLGLRGRGFGGHVDAPRLSRGSAARGGL